ncbi:MAG: DUF1800 domain-containing protein [Phycisphaerales bacterium]|nr:DUF1800 domain-containing protein [Phycisphaerales bacterium]
MPVPCAAVDGPAVELEIQEPVEFRREAPTGRRGWLKALLAGGAMTPLARGGPPGARSAGQGWTVAEDVDPGVLLVKLVRRITMGITPEELTLANQLGYEGYLERHLDYTAIDDTETQLKLAIYTTLSMTPYQLYVESSVKIIQEMIDATFIRAVFSKRQLFERMVEFWTDHFNIDTTKNDCAFLKTLDDSQVIRANALGKFPQLLEASARSPAMQIYLDNYVSSKLRPNENYARELLELHTLGVDGGYTQADVENVARCFTGWGIYSRSASPELMGTFRFSPSDHDTSQKTVLGQTISAGGGISDGLTVLQILCEHPSTARFLARKLTRWLLGEGAPDSIISDVAATYTATGGDIRAMIRAALRPNYLHAAPLRYKRPFHAYISAVRAMGSEFTGAWTFRQWLAAAGHVPFMWVTPDGYPDSVDYWGGLLMERWNFASSFGEGQISGLRWVLDEVFPDLSPDAVIDKLDRLAFGGEMPPGDRDIVLAYLGQGPREMELVRDAVGLTLGSPSYQWY